MPPDVIPGHGNSAGTLSLRGMRVRRIFCSDCGLSGNSDQFVMRQLRILLEDMQDQVERDYSEDL